MVAAKDLKRDSTGFVDLAERLLKAGHNVRFPAEGTSMLPTIQDGDTLTVAPVEPLTVKTGDVVLYRAGARAIAHRIVEVRATSPTARVFLARGDGKSGVDQPIEPEQILGAVIGIERQPRWKRLARRAGLLLIACALGLPASARAEFLTGSYTGNGTTQSITQIGFVPDVVVIKGNTNQNAVIRTSTMVGDSTKDLFGGAGLAAGLVMSIDAANAGRFTIGSNAKVNSLAVTYRWAAFKAVAGQIVVGTYTGNGTSRSITGLGFSPAAVIVLPAANTNPNFKTTSMAGNTSFEFRNTTGPFTNYVTSVNADGFTVGNGAAGNANGATFHYIALKSVAGTLTVGTYVGNNTDDQEKTGVGFLPEWVFIKSDANNAAVHKTASTGAFVDTSLAVLNSANVADQVQSLNADGFTIGKNASVNQNNRNFYYVAFARAVPATAVKLMSFTATRYDGKILLQWKTGYEVDNLGFRVYREQKGEKVRLTSNLIAGSGLLVREGVATSVGHAYGWWDTNPPEAKEKSKYWLEDVDLTGSTTMHGPVVASGGTLPPPGQIQPRLLNRVSGPAEAGHYRNVVAPALAEAGRHRETAGPGLAEAGHHRDNPAPISVESGFSRTLESASVASGSSEASGSPSVASGFSRTSDFLSRGHALSSVQSASPATSSIVSAPTVQQSIAGAPAVKILVRTEGWYRVPYCPLAASNLDSNIDAGSLRLFVDGTEHSLKIVAPGGRFGPGASVEFYGAGADTPYSDTRMYWLTTGGAAGRRVAMADASTSPTGVGSFPKTIEHKSRETFFAALSNGDAENFFGEIITTEPTAVTIAADRVNAGGATLEVVLQGVTSVSDAGHRVAVRLNGTDLGSIAFEGRARVSKVFSLPASDLTEGDNVVSLTAMNGESDVSLLDTLRLTYQRALVASGDHLRFSADGRRAVTVGGFSAANIRVYDVSDPSAVVEVVGRVTAAGSEYRVSLIVPGVGTGQLVALTDAGLASPVSVVANRPSSWSSRQNDADYVILAHAEFLPAVQPLKTLRASNGHRVAIVDVEDVYDEFSYGQKTPYAIRDFLKHARALWRAAPRFVVLVGNATTDPRNHLGMGEPDFVPTKMIETRPMETASDDWFVDADGDGIPELAAIGRLPARTLHQAAAMIDKIVGYDQAETGAWAKAIALVADEPNSDDLDFAAASEGLRAFVPSDYPVDEIFRGRLGTADARSTLLSRINEGQAIVHYSGHGSVQVWRDDLLTTDDARRFTNGVRLPLFVMMNCLNGFFHGLFPEESLAEALVRAGNGGAVAAWASSGFTDAGSQQALDAAFFRLMFSGQYASVGEAIVAAKAQATDADVRRTWIFFGDPAMQLKGLVHLKPEADGLVRLKPDSREMARSAAMAPSPISVVSDFSRIDQSAVSSSNRTSAEFPLLADFDGDKLADVFLSWGTRWRFALSSGRTVVGAWDRAWEIHPADLNGDGLTDLVLFDRATGIWAQAINQGFARFRYSYGVWGSGWDIAVGDFNGDTRDDVLLVDPLIGARMVAHADDTGLFTYATADAPAGSTMTIGDFNGDGLADVFYYNSTTGDWTLATSEGGGRFSSRSGTISTGWDIRTANFNVDGRTDLLLYNPATGAFSECLSAPQPGSFACTSGTWAPGLDVVVLGGANRDDELLYQPESGAWVALIHRGDGVSAISGRLTPNLMISAGDLNGDGRADLFIYDPLTGASTIGPLK